MDNSLISSTAYQTQINELTNDLINHGYGEILIKVTSLKDTRIRIEIKCGKNFIYIIEKFMDTII